MKSKTNANKKVVKQTSSEKLAEIFDIVPDVDYDEIVSYLDRVRDSESYNDFNLALDKGLVEFAADILKRSGYLDQDFSDEQEIEKAILFMLSKYSPYQRNEDEKEFFKNTEVWLGRYNEHAFIPTGADVCYFLTQEELKELGFYFDRGYGPTGKKYKKTRLDAA
jgi:hypothetical protein